LKDGKVKLELPPVRIDPGSLSDVKLPSVPISVPLDPETSDSLKSLAPRLHTLLTFLQAALLIFGGAKAGQLVMPVVGFLGQFIAAWSIVRQMSASGAITQSSGVSPGVDSSTRGPGS
jgi:hypothetical protein